MEAKQSWQTKEFWMAVAAGVVSLVTLIVGAVIDSPQTSMVMQILGAIGTFLSTMGYGTIRTFQKASDNKVRIAETIAKLKGAAGNP